MKQDTLVAFIIGDALHRAWMPRLADAVAMGKDLAKCNGIKGIVVIHSQKVMQTHGTYRYEDVTRYAHGEDVVSHL